MRCVAICIPSYYIMYLGGWNWSSHASSMEKWLKDWCSCVLISDALFLPAGLNDPRVVSWVSIMYEGDKVDHFMKIFLPFENGWSKWILSMVVFTFPIFNLMQSFTLLLSLTWCSFNLVIGERIGLVCMSLLFYLWRSWIFFLLGFSNGLIVDVFLFSLTCHKCWKEIVNG